MPLFTTQARGTNMSAEVSDWWSEFARARQVVVKAAKTGDPPASEDVLRLQLCDMCRAPRSKKLCSGCMLAHYCSKECQIYDWHTHKPRCKLAQASSVARQALAEIIESTVAMEQVRILPALCPNPIP